MFWYESPPRSPRSPRLFCFLTASNILKKIKIDSQVLTTELAEATTEGREGRDGPQLSADGPAPTGERERVRVCTKSLGGCEAAGSGDFDDFFGAADGQTAGGTSSPIVNIS